MKTVTAIICAYNEEKTIGGVIKSLSHSTSFSEIIVVNDGSTDGTENEIKKLKEDIEIVDIHLKDNKGKGYAMAIGVERAHSDVILFIDADISDIVNEHFNQLLFPIVNNHADLVLGQPSETLIPSKINPFKSFTGQRSLLRKDILPILNKMKNSRFGVETLINLYYKSLDKRVKYVILKDLTHPSKFGKTSKSNAVIELAKEGKEIGVTALKNYDLVIKSLHQAIS